MACIRPSVWLAAVLALAAALLAGTPASAGAAIGGVRCADGTFLCGTLTVPLARDGRTAGAVGLAVARRPAAADPTATAVVALAGGPGQAARPFATSFAGALAPLLAGRDLLVFDQRGTGGSDPLRCDALAADGSGAVRACADELGAARGYYRSVDSALDIEALRAAGGYERLVLYGVSYGTKVALTYAALFPGRVAALVLDSVVPLDGPDAFGRPSFAALSRVLGELCAAGACRTASPTPGGDLRRLAARLARTPLAGTITGPSGTRIRVRTGEAGLWKVLLGGDLNPALRAELPGAVRAALRRDATPLLRLVARAQGLSGTTGLQRASEVNDVLFTATRCGEGPFPWNPAADATTRAAQAQAALRGTPASAFAPFTRATALRSSVLALCAGWPADGADPVPLGPLPDVPTLVLSGTADLRTPLEEARRAVRSIPGALVAPVAQTGHSVLGSDIGGCSDDLLAAFATGDPAACTPRPSPIRPTPMPPTRLDALPGGSAASRAARAVLLTLDDVRRQLIGDAIAAGRDVRAGSRTGGLRGGVAIVGSRGVTLRRVVYVPGVRVSGTLALERGASSAFRVEGRAAVRGRLVIDGSGRVSARLGGRRVRLRAAARASAPAARLTGPLGLPAVPVPGLRAP